MRVHHPIFKVMGIAKHREMERPHPPDHRADDRMAPRIPEHASIFCMASI